VKPDDDDDDDDDEHILMETLMTRGAGPESTPMSVYTSMSFIILKFKEYGFKSKGLCS